MKKILKPLLIALFSCVMLVLLSLVCSAKYENTHVNTGDSLEDLIAVAQTQIGYMEGDLSGEIPGDNDCTKYGAWYPMNNNAWCAMFVSWCADQAGISTSVIPKHASCDVGMQWFIERELFSYGSAYGGTYTPKRGDIVYFGYKTSSGVFDSTHVGIIYEVDAEKIYSIEGNSSNKVQTVPYKMSSSYVLGYGRPNYSLDIITGETGYYETTPEFLNFRESNSASSGRLDQIPKGTLLNITQISDNNWGKTTYNGKSGWVSMDYCTRVYLITYDANGGENAPKESVKKPGVPLKLSTQLPVRDGHSFLGWAADPAAKEPEYKAGAELKEEKDMTLYAIWDVKGYTVSYDANKGTGAPAAQIKEHGKELTLSLEQPRREGHTFLGWAVSATALKPDYAAGGKYKNDVSITLYAVWQVNSYTISYDANGGTGAPEAQVKKHGTPITITSVKPTLENYTFLGWSEDKNAADPTYRAGAQFTKDKNTVLYAVWGEYVVRQSYTVAYNGNAGTGAPQSQTKQEGIDLIITSTIPAKKGYEFQGWADSASAKWAQYIPGDSYSADADITLYAVWVKELPDITLTVSGGGRVLKQLSDDDTVLWFSIIADKGNSISLVSVNGIAAPIMGDTCEYLFKLSAATKNNVEVAFTDNSKLWISPYTDVKRTAWYFDAVEYCSTNNIMTGTSAVQFSPNSTLTRGQFVTILGRLYENSGKELKGAAQLPFTDVKSTAYYYKYLCWAYENKIISGVTQTRFAPNASITREQLCTILYNYTLYTGKDSSGVNKTLVYGYKDHQKISSWAKDAVAWAVDRKYLSGSNNALDPSGSATRAQAAVIIKNYAS